MTFAVFLIYLSSKASTSLAYGVWERHVLLCCLIVNLLTWCEMKLKIVCSKSIVILCYLVMCLWHSFHKTKLKHSRWQCAQKREFLCVILNFLFSSELINFQYFLYSISLSVNSNFSIEKFSLQWFIIWQLWILHVSWNKF